MFADANYIIDPKNEERAIGFSVRANLLVVVTFEQGSRLRIVSAWKATATDASNYKSQNQGAAND